METRHETVTVRFRIRPSRWLVNAYAHPRWKDVHGNRWWVELWHPSRRRVLVGRIDGRFGLHR